MRPRRSLAAVHEAGHVVVGWHFGHLKESGEVANIVRSEDLQSRGVTWNTQATIPRSNHTAVEREVVRLFGGMVAQTILRKESRLATLLSGCGPDQDSAEEWLQLLPDPDVAERELWARTRRLLVEHRDLLETVADHLQEQKSLDRSELDFRPSIRDP